MSNNPAFKFTPGAPLILDGGFGTELAKCGLTAADFAGNLGLPLNQDGNLDLLALTRPDILSGIYRAYLYAGADIITTCTFSSTEIEQEKFQTEHLVSDINRASAKLALDEAAKFSTAEHPRYVAGSVGPTSHSLTFALIEDEDLDEDDATDDLADSYAGQIAALVSAGVDLLILETFFDVKNSRAALTAAAEVFEILGKSVPIIVSATIANGGRLLTGLTASQYFHKLTNDPHFGKLISAASLNCSFGGEALGEYLAELAKETALPLCFYPNAGLPAPDGSYSETPEHFAAVIKTLNETVSLSVTGGCCGTTPAHIATLAAAFTKA